MRLSLLTPLFLSALSALITAEECKWYVEKATEKNGPVHLSLDCPPPSSLKPNSPYTQAKIDTNLCLANYGKGLAKSKDPVGSAWGSCDETKIASGYVDEIGPEKGESMSCQPGDVNTPIKISDFAHQPEGSKNLVCGSHTITGAVVTPEATAA